MPNEIEKKYNHVSKKFKLPEFTEIDNEFEISTLESADFLLRNVLRKVEEKLEFYTNLLGDLLQPDTSSLSSMHELRFIEEEEKNNMYKLFKKLMKTHRTIIGLFLDSNEKKQAEFLKNFMIDWSKMKKELILLTEKMRDSWEKETTMEEDLGYFG